MTPLVTKTLLGFGGLSIIGGGSVLAWQKGVFSSSLKSVKDRLIFENYQVLDSSNVAWPNIFEKYKSNDNKWKFSNDQIGVNSPSIDVQKLKERCTSVLEGSFEDKDEYYKASKWCVVPRKVESFIPASSLLKTEGDDTNEKPRWRNILSDFKAKKTTTSGTTKYPMEGITINESSDQDDTNITAIKGGCKTRRDKFHYELDFEKTLEEVNRWCTKG